jgi:hypothetical protein
MRENNSGMNRSQVEPLSPVIELVKPNQKWIEFVTWLNQVNNWKTNAELIFDTYLDTQPHTKGIVQMAIALYKHQHPTQYSKFATTSRIHKSLDYVWATSRQFILFLLSTDGFQTRDVAETHNVRGSARYRNEIREGKLQENIPTGLS